MSEESKDFNLTFEEALKELEKIVTDVDAGKIGLEESMSQYESGMKLIKYCRSILEQAEKRIEIIHQENDLPAPTYDATTDNHDE
jgi:exodeoxyribonuclease VII small subunit